MEEPEALPVAPESASIPNAGKKRHSLRLTWTLWLTVLLALRASMSAVARVWKSMGPAFVLEQVDDSSDLELGNLMLTVVFHLKETPLDAPIYDALNRQQNEGAAETAAKKKDRLEATLDFLSPGEDLEPDELDDYEEEDDTDTSIEGSGSQPAVASTPPKLTMSDDLPKERPMATLAPPQLCVSFLLSVAGKQPERQSLLKFEESQEEASADRPACLEVFGDGSNVNPENPNVV